MKKTLKTILSVSAAVILSAGLIFMPVAAAEADAKDTKADITFSSGTLTLQSLPSFDFGTHTISTVEQAYAGTSTNNIEVADARGTATGWTLSVKLGKFSNDNGVTFTLNGAKIKITPSVAYTTNGSGILPGTVTPIEAISGNMSTQSITVAADTQGAGLMTNVIAASELTVYGGTALVGGHSAILDWILGDTP